MAPATSTTGWKILKGDFLPFGQVWLLGGLEELQRRIAEPRNGLHWVVGFAILGEPRA